MSAVLDFVTFFAALSDPTRLRLLHLMKDGEICVCFLQGVLRTNQPKISRHLAYLKSAGLVEGRQEGKWIYYSLKEQGANLQPLLKEILNRIEKEPQMTKDTQRLQQICCAPTRYGFSKTAAKTKTARRDSPGR